MYLYIVYRYMYVLCIYIYIYIYIYMYTRSPPKDDETSLSGLAGGLCFDFNPWEP